MWFVLYGVMCLLNATLILFETHNLFIVLISQLCVAASLASWLRDKGFKAPYVSPDYPNDSAWRPDGKEDPKSLPTWANKFASTLDEQKCVAGPQRFAPVTAAECLAILDAIPED